VDIKNYVASGILEAYALGDLPAEERAAVEAMLLQHPELQTELTLIEEGLEVLAVETAMAPPASLKKNLFAALDLEEETAEEAPVVTPSPSAEPKVVEMQPTPSRVWNYVAAASIALALVSSYLAYDYHNRWKQVEKVYSETLASYDLLADQNNKVNNKLDQIEEDFKVLVNPDFARIEMGSVVEGETFSASIYWNQKTEEAYLSIKELRELSEEQQYQLWAIVDGKPVDMGVFDISVDGLTKMKSIANAATFAVTIEPKGGSVNPTLEAMQVAGNVG
jgi:anti-sigma-K factor RskA